MSGRARKAATREDWAARVDRSIDHLRGALDRPVMLDELAHAACFSPFHFHRIFKQVTGETVREATMRLRLERAARLLSSTKRPITEIALESGFAGSAELSRGFRARFGRTPSDHRRSRPRAAGEGAFAEHAAKARSTGVAEPLADVVVRSLRPTPIARVRVVDPYRGTNLLDGYGELQRFIGAHPEIRFGRMIGAQLDDPDVTPAERVRHDLCVEIPEGVRGEGAVRTAVLAGGRYACVEVAGPIEATVRAWDALFGTWLPESGLEPRDEPAIEVWLAPPGDDGRYHLELRLPVKTAR